MNPTCDGRSVNFKSVLAGVATILVLVFSMSVHAGDFMPRHSAAHVLQNGELTVEVMDPNDPERYNRGSRFSPVANILRAVVEGKDFLFSPVSHDPKDENGGLPIEFDVDTVGGPPGFAEAGIGEGFLKIGVGVLRKTDWEYDFFKSELIERAKTTAEWGPDWASFEQVSPAINGYANKLGAVVWLQDTTIFIRYRLTNTGKKNFATEQYAHNYFCFDNALVGPNYEVRFPYDFEAAGMDGSQRKVGRRIVYEKTLPQPMNIRVPMPENYSGPNSVTVRNLVNGQQITATTSISGTRTFVHASADYLCPEQFVSIGLKPGESAEWTRTYELH